MQSTGVIYVATGAAYVNDAELSAKSLKAVHPDLPVCLFSDVRSDATVFDQQLDIPNPHRRSKVDCLARTPFERTLYLDTDTRVVAPITDGFILLDRFDMAATHDHQRHPMNSNSAKAQPEGVPAAFPEMNSGVLFFRKNERVMAFLRFWTDEFKRLNPKRDQPLLRRLLWNQPDIKIYVLPPEYNVRWMKTVMFNGKRESEIKVLHLKLYKSHKRRWHRLRKIVGSLAFPLSNVRQIVKAFRIE